MNIVNRRQRGEVGEDHHFHAMSPHHEEPGRQQEELALSGALSLYHDEQSTWLDFAKKIAPSPEVDEESA